MLLHELELRLPAVVLSAGLVAPRERPLDVSHRLSHALTREHHVSQSVKQSVRLFSKLEARVGRVLRQRVAREPVQRLAHEHVVEPRDLVPRRDPFIGGFKPIEEAAESFRSEGQSELFGEFSVHGVR